MLSILWLLFLASCCTSAQQAPTSSSAVSKVSFEIDQAHRIADKSNATAIFSFETSSFGAIATGSTVTLSYPSGFFRSDATPTAQVSDGALGSASSPSSFSIVITISQGAFAAIANVTITLRGLTMGSATGMLQNVIFISTSSDTLASVPFPSGNICYPIFNATPTAGYISSTITLTGSKFVTLQDDPTATCSANFGEAIHQCNLIDESRITIIIGTLQNYSISTMKISFHSKNNITYASGDSIHPILQPIEKPFVNTIAPIGGYQSSRITVGGANFITPAQGGTCSALVGGTAAASCSISSATSVVVVLGASSPAASSDVNVTFNGGGAGAQAIKAGFSVLSPPSITSATPLAGYVSSTITVTGTNFVTETQDAAASCRAVVGGTSAQCTLVDATTAKLTIEAGASVGPSTVEVTIVSAGAVSPHNVGTSASSVLTVLNSPTASTFTPLAGYQSSRITVGGANFITPAQGGTCSAFVCGTFALGCYVNSSSVLVIHRSSTLVDV